MKRHVQEFREFSINEGQSRNMQEKIMKDLLGFIEGMGFEAVVNTTWSNMGKILIQPKDDFMDVATIKFHFDDKTMNFSLTVLGKKILSQPPRPDYYDFYMYYDNEGFAQYKKFKQILMEELEMAKNDGGM